MCFMNTGPSFYSQIIFIRISEKKNQKHAKQQRKKQNNKPKMALTDFRFSLSFIICY